MITNHPPVSSLALRLTRFHHHIGGGGRGASFIIIIITNNLIPPPPMTTNANVLRLTARSWRGCSFGGGGRGLAVVVMRLLVDCCID